jgi:hypothetical protein
MEWIVNRGQLEAINSIPDRPRPSTPFKPYKDSPPLAPH